MRLRGKFLIPCMSILFVCMLTMASVAILRVSGSLEQVTIGQFEQTSKLLAAAGDDWVKARVADVGTWASDDILVKAAGSSFTAEAAQAVAVKSFDKYLKNYKFLDYIALVDANGKTIIEKKAATFASGASAARSISSEPAVTPNGILISRSVVNKKGKSLGNLGLKLIN